MVRGKGEWVPYDAKIIATKCPLCEAEPPNRCRPISGGSPSVSNYPPHAVRVRASEKEAVE